MNDVERRELKQRLRGSSPFAGTFYDNLVSVFDDDRILDLFETIEPDRRDPTLLLAAVQYLTFDEPSSRLARIYANPASRDSAELVTGAFVDFCTAHEERIVRLMQNRDVHDSDVNRCAVLLPVLGVVRRESGREVALVDCGASAGLTLLFDRYRYDYAGGPALGHLGSLVRLNCELRGHVPRIEPSVPEVGFRVGIDIEPMRVDRPDDEKWLRACTLVGNVAAEQRLSGAIDLARREWPDVRTGSVTDLLPSMVTEVPDADELCLFSCFSLLRMTPGERDRLSRVIAGESHVRPIWWIAYDRSEVFAITDVEAPAVVVLTKYDNGMESFVRLLATAGSLGEWLEWRDSASIAW